MKSGNKQRYSDCIKQHDRNRENDKKVSISNKKNLSGPKLQIYQMLGTSILHVLGSFS